MQDGTLLVPNGWSSMGYAIPAAMAAKLVRPKREVACVVGDGGFLMQAGEMATAARLGSRVLFVILRDESLSLIHAKQRRRGYRITGVELPARCPIPPPHYFGVPCLPARSAREFRGWPTPDAGGVPWSSRRSWTAAGTRSCCTSSGRYGKGDGTHLVGGGGCISLG